MVMTFGFAVCDSGLGPEARGRALLANQDIQMAHDEMASEGQTSDEGAAGTSMPPFVTSCSCPPPLASSPPMYHINSLDGRKDLSLGAFAGDVDFHFVCFVHSGGRLFELDGLKAAPINRGPTTPDSLLKDAVSHAIKK